MTKFTTNSTTSGLLTCCFVAPFSPALAPKTSDMVRFAPPRGVEDGPLEHLWGVVSVVGPFENLKTIPICVITSAFTNGWINQLLEQSINLDTHAISTVYEFECESGKLNLPWLLLSFLHEKRPHLPHPAIFFLTSCDVESHLWPSGEDQHPGKTI